MSLTHRWDLSALFESEAEAISFSQELRGRARDFERDYKGNLSSDIDYNMTFTEYEDICEGLGRIMTYAGLKLAENSDKGAFYADCELKSNDIQSHILFFELELSSLDEELHESIMQSAPKWAFFLKRLIANRKYQLSLGEEKIMLALAPLGSGAFARLFDEFYSNLKIDFGGKTLNEGEILALSHNKDRSVRKSAQKAFTKKLVKNRALLTYILNMVRKDLAINTQIRGYESKESARHISNQTSQKSVDALVSSVNSAMDLSKDYYALKGKLLGLKLKDYDRYAPVQAESSEVFSYEDGLALVLESMREFSQVFYDIAKKATQEGWIDSHPRDKKRGGAFSHGAVPCAHPYVLLNHTDNRRDVFTIAHEFGHMIHQELSKKQGYLNMDTPLTTAETASVFAEMILFEKIKKSASKEELRVIYASKLEDIIATLFRQIVMTNFERKIHSLEGELTSDEFDQIWIQENERMFGSSVKLTKNYASWWSYIPHFVHTPFYCYAYSYGQLLVLALFGLYKRSEDKEAFIKTYIKFLESGGSRDPRELVLTFGLDIEDDAFWQVGIDEVRALLDEFKALI